MTGHLIDYGDGTPIGVAVATLSAELRGPRRARSDLIAEVRDGLYDAADAYRDLGLSDEVAERRSLADFGDLRQVAGRMQAELTARHARRTALAMAVAFPGLVVLWDGLWLMFAPATATPPSHGIAHVVISSLIDVIALLTAVTALAGVVVLRLGARTQARADRLASIVGRLCLTGISLTLAAALSMLVVEAPGGDSGLHGSAAIAMWGLSLLVAAWLLSSALRCVRLGRTASIPSVRHSQ